MHNPIKVISEYGLSTTSQITAITTIKYEVPYANWTIQQFWDATCSVVGTVSDCGYKSIQEAKYTFMYLVQNFIILEKRGEVAEPTDVFNHSIQQCSEFREEHKTALSLELSETDESTDGTKRRSGSKTELAYAIYCQHVDDEDAASIIKGKLVSELDMKPAGATTYYHAAKKRYNSSN